MPSKEFNVIWAKIAASDLENIISYISEKDLEMAFHIFIEIKQSASDLKSFPNRGRVVPEFKNFGIKIYREIVVKVWRVIYRIDGDNVNILAVFDSRRNIEDILLDRLLII